jgi:hypothetical protein
MLLYNILMLCLLAGSSSCASSSSSSSSNLYYEGKLYSGLTREVTNKVLEKYNLTHEYQLPLDEVDTVEDPDFKLPVLDVSDDPNAVHTLTIGAVVSKSAFEFVEGNIPDILGIIQEQAIYQIREAFENSDIPNIMVEVEVVIDQENDFRITTAALGQLKNKYASLFTRKCNVIAGFTYPQRGNDTANGWATVPGDRSVQTMTWGVFRHELAHNVGGSHCFPVGGTHYRYGFKHPISKKMTALCGNGLRMYSGLYNHPEHGVMGHPEQANMARLWSERIAAMVKHYINP